MRPWRRWLGPQGDSPACHAPATSTEEDAMPPRRSSPNRRLPGASNQRQRIVSAPTSIAQIDLAPPPARTYFQGEREWREEVIYFLMVDRFHDEQPRACVPRAGRSAGVAVPADFYGGNIRGITRNLA